MAPRFLLARKKYFVKETGRVCDKQLAASPLQAHRRHKISGKLICEKVYCCGSTLAIFDVPSDAIPTGSVAPA